MFGIEQADEKPNGGRALSELLHLEQRSDGSRPPVGLQAAVATRLLCCIAV
jgi:hypothetical protein